MLLVDLVEPIELPNHLIRFRRHILPAAEPGVGLNRFDQIFCAAVVQEKDSLPEAPQGRRAKLITRSVALAHIVGQARPHVMERQIGVQVGILVPQRLHGRFAGVQRRGMAHRTADIAEQLPPSDNGLIVRRRHRWREEAHEHRELHHVAGYFERLRGVKVGPILRRRVKITNRCLIPFLREELVCYSLLDVVGFA